VKEDSGRIVSVRVGLAARYPRPKWDKTSGTTWTSAYVKSPVNGPVRVGPEGLEGDQQYDRRVHGGPEMALLAYADEHYEFWRDDLSIAEMGPGGFGENLTVEGMNESNVCVGDVWAAGEPRLQVSQPRGPCLNIARRWDRQDLMDRVMKTGWGGWYLRVLKGGMIAVRQPIKRIQRPNPDFTIEVVFQLAYGQRKDPAMVKKLAKCKELSRPWREKFDRIASGGETP